MSFEENLALAQESYKRRLKRMYKKYGNDSKELHKRVGDAQLSILKDYGYDIFYQISTTCPSIF